MLLNNIQNKSLESGFIGKNFKDWMRFARYLERKNRMFIIFTNASMFSVFGAVRVWDIETYRETRKNICYSLEELAEVLLEASQVGTGGRIIDRDNKGHLIGNLFEDFLNETTEEK